MVCLTPAAVASAPASGEVQPPVGINTMVVNYNAIQYR
jgi:hypothetical protein